MPMSPVRKWFLGVILGAVVLHVLAVWSAPRLIMAIAIDRIGARAGGANTLEHAPRITEASRDVVRPAPDLAYSVCVYDVSAGPVRLVLPKTATYASVSLFDDTTNNFLVVNDRSVEGAAQEIWVVGSATQAGTPPASVQVVEAPSDKGVVLFRRVIPSDADWPRIEAERHRAACEPLA